MWLSVLSGNQLDFCFILPNIIIMQMGISEIHAFPLFLINPFYHLKKKSVIRLAKVGTLQKRHAELVHEMTMTEAK